MKILITIGALLAVGLAMMFLKPFKSKVEIVRHLERPWRHQKSLLIKDVQVVVKSPGVGLLSTGSGVTFKISGTHPSTIDCIPMKVSRVHIESRWLPETLNKDQIPKEHLTGKPIVAEYVLTPILDQDRTLLDAIIGRGVDCENGNPTVKAFEISFNEHVPTWNFGNNGYRARAGELTKEFFIHQGK